MSLDPKQKAALIRKGNELFNQGRLKEAITIFIQTNYKDGLARIGDHFLYQRKEPVNALSFYKRAGYQKGVDLLIRNIVKTIRTFMEADQYTEKWQSYLDKNFQKEIIPGEEITEEEDTNFHLKMLKEHERASEKKPKE
jgi:hypothetical protein